MVAKCLGEVFGVHFQDSTSREYFNYYSNRDRDFYTSKMELPDVPRAGERFNAYGPVRTVRLCT